MNFDSILNFIIDSGYLPHAVICVGIRREIAKRKAEIAAKSLAALLDHKTKFVQELRSLPIAVETGAANAQHYEVPAAVMATFLGPRMKYSCCLFSEGAKTLAEAEDAMLQTYVDRMDIKDGMTILDLGCGWGSGVIYFVEHFPSSKIIGFLNSKSQKEYIDEEAHSRGFKNIEVIIGDVVNYEFEHESVDRMLSVEMFEHMKNYDELMAKVVRCLKPGGKILIQVFAHKDTPYHFEDGWMSTHFFTGGLMPSSDLLLYFQKDLTILNHWWISGKNYNKTSKHWIAKFISCKKELWPHLIEAYGAKNANTWFNRWKVYHMACAEMFATNKYNTYGTCHLIFGKKSFSS
ncbi:methyltransferase [Mycena epipterygia]|nr:methyltransferase [Mycena epipterygia]